jgi:type I restriction enzyme S subunit
MEFLEEMEFVGDIPEGWKWVKLGEVVKIKHGYAFPGKNITNQDTGKVLVTPGNFNIGGGFKSDKLRFYSGDYPKEYEFQGGEIIVVMTDLSKDADILGYSAKVPTDKKYKYLHNQRIGLVEITSSHIDKDFIYWLMRTTDYHFFIVGGASGTSVMHTSPDRISEYSFPLPPLHEQKAIAEVLSSIDDKIELLNRQNKTLEEMAMTLFRQWFIDANFDGTIGQIVNVQGGYAFKSKDFKLNGNHSVIKIKNITNSIVNINDTEFIDESVVENLDTRFKISSGDILIAMTGEVGEMGIVPKTDKNLWLNQRVGLLREKYEGSRFLAYLHLKSEFGRDYIVNVANGSVQANISASDIENCPFVQLSENEIKSYSKTISPFFEKIISNLAQIQTLEKLRDTLLPKLMSGEVNIL